MAVEDHSPARHRFFAESLEGDLVALSSDQAHHARDVLRLATEAEVEVFDGAGGVAAGRLQLSGRQAVAVRVLERRRAPAPPGPTVEIAFSIPKGKRLDWLLAKATELGAAAVAPVVFERSVVRPTWSEHAHRRWRAVCVAAAKQCGANVLPHILPPRPVAVYLAGRGDRLGVFGQTAQAEDLPAVLAGLPAGRGIAALVGPEGGMTAAERQGALDAGFRPVRLGGYVLRVETAALAILAAIRTCCGG